MTEQPVKRSWLPHLWTLMVLTVFVVIGGIGIPPLSKYFRQRLMLDRLTRANVHFDFEHRGPSWLRRIVSDKWMQPFDLRGIDFQSATARLRVDGPFIARLAEFRAMRSLSLADSVITDECLKQLAGLDLQELNISGTPIGDAGIFEIGKQSYLEVLILDATNVTDEGLASLHQLHHLQVLGVRDTDITDLGLRALKKVAPDCRVDWTPRSASAMYRTESTTRP